MKSAPICIGRGSGQIWGSWIVSRVQVGQNLNRPVVIPMDTYSQIAYPILHQEKKKKDQNRRLGLGLVNTVKIFYQIK